MVVTPQFAYEFYSELEQAQLDEFPPLESLDRSGGRLVTKLSPDDTRSIRTITPWDFFSNGSYPFWEHARLYADALRNGRVKRTKVLKSPDLPDRFALLASYNSGKVIATVFDSTYGFNPTHWFLKFGEEDSTVDSRFFEYQELGEIHVPSKCVFVSTREFDGKRTLAMIREFEARETSINETISNSEFGVESFQLVDGERLVDKVENKLLVKSKDGFVPAASYVPDNPSLPKRSSNRLLFMMLASGVALLIVYFSISGKSAS